MPHALSWVVLTQGTRPTELAAAVASLRSADPTCDVVVVQNGGAPIDAPPGARVVHLADNLGVPGGRDIGVKATQTPLVGFLDDDALLLTSHAAALVADEFAQSPELGAVSFRIIDEDGASSRRHVPRIGGSSALRSGSVATFLGGASAIRRSAYDRAGGYCASLFYADEELDLAWRLYDTGAVIRYAADIEVWHPRTAISRHTDGWWLTGRNRVMIARRNLPWPIAIIHVSAWLFGGLLRTPDRACRRAYAEGWWSGWSESVQRHPIRWRTVLEITRAGRPPIV